MTPSDPNISRLAEDMRRTCCRYGFYQDTKPEHERVCTACRASRALLDAAARVEKLEAAARAFVDKLNLVTPAINGAFTFGHIHGNVYDGPTYEHELAALRAALSSPSKPSEATS